MKINGLILAAGNSSRLGQPKQLVNYQGRTLLADIEAKLLNCCDQVFVVLGYQAELFYPELHAAQVIINPNWQTGMGSSLVCGVQVAGNQADGLLIALADQPLIEAEHYQKLTLQFNHSRNQIIATSYRHQCGVPAIFPSSYWQALAEINAKSGAQSLLQKNAEQVVSIVCETAEYDVDTVDDLLRLNINASDSDLTSHQLGDDESNKPS